MEVIPVKNAFTSEIIHITKEKKYIKAIINDTNLVFYTKIDEIDQSCDGLFFIKFNIV